MRFFLDTDGAFCNGVLITSRHIYTAAHCFKNANASTIINVSIGDTGQHIAASGTLNGNCFINPVANAQMGASGEGCFQPHNGFDPQFEQDFALLELATPVPRSLAIPAPIALSSTPGISLAAGQPVRWAAYNAGNTTRFTEDTTFITRANGSLGFAAIAIGGNSGSGLFWKRSTAANSRFPWDDREYLVAILLGPQIMGLPNTAFLDAHLVDSSTSVRTWRDEFDGLASDNCPGVVNADQIDTDGDGRGDACDLCALVTPADGDEPLPNRQTNCNARQEDARIRPPDRVSGAVASA